MNCCQDPYRGEHLSYPTCCLKRKSKLTYASQNSAYYLLPLILWLFLSIYRTCHRGLYHWQHWHNDYFNICKWNRFIHYIFTRTWLRYVRVFAIAIPSVVCLSVTLVHPTQGVEPFGNISSLLCTLPILWPPCKILRRSSQGNPSSPHGALNARGVAKYSDSVPIKGYISWTVQDTCILTCRWPNCPLNGRGQGHVTPFRMSHP